MKAFGCWLTALLLLPTIAFATPIISSGAVVGWSNSAGTFVVDRSAFLVTDGSASYSTASSLFTQQGNHLGYFDGATVFSFGPLVDVMTSVFVEETGTISGNLLGGLLTMTAGADGIPGIAAPGESLIVGHAIDAAALNLAFGVEILFALTYTSPALSNLGQYLTLFGPYPNWTVDGGATFAPWGVDWGPTSGFTNPDYFRTMLIPEPPVLALFALAALVLLAMLRRAPLRSRRAD